MRNLILAAIVLMSGTWAQAESQSGLVSAPITNAAVPVGLTSQEMAFVEIVGIFPNTCYRWGKAIVGQLAENVHVVEAYAVLTSDPCLMVLIPFRQTVEFGMLPAGDHIIRFVAEGGAFFERILKIQ